MIVWRYMGVLKGYGILFLVIISLLGFFVKVVKYIEVKFVFKVKLMK